MAPTAEMLAASSRAKAAPLASVSAEACDTTASVGSPLLKEITVFAKGNPLPSFRVALTVKGTPTVRDVAAAPAPSSKDRLRLGVGVAFAGAPVTAMVKADAVTSVPSASLACAEICVAPPVVEAAAVIAIAAVPVLPELAVALLGMNAR